MYSTLNVVVAPDPAVAEHRDDPHGQGLRAGTGQVQGRTVYFVSSVADQDQDPIVSGLFGSPDPDPLFTKRPL